MKLALRNLCSFQSLAGASVAALLLAGVVRSLGFLTYVGYAIDSPLQVLILEGSNVHFAWRVQHGLCLYPDADHYPYVANLTSPVYFWVVGGLGRLLGADVAGLYTIGRSVTFACTLLSVVLMVAFLGCRYGRWAAVAAAAFTCGAAPMVSFGIMVRADMLAQLLGLAGFLLSARPTRGALLGASLLLSLSCLTKQTAGVYLVAAAAALIWHDRQIGRAIGLCLLTAAIVLATVAALALGGEPHIVPCLLGQSATPWTLATLALFVQVMAERSPDLFWFAIAGSVIWFAGPLRDRRWLSLAIVLLSSAVVTCAKIGADLNYFLGLCFVEAAAVAVLCQAALGGAVRRSLTAAAILPGLLFMLPGQWYTAKTALQVYRVDRVLHTAAGRRRLAEYRQLQRLAEDPGAAMFSAADAVAVHQGTRAVLLDSCLFRLRVEAGKTDPAELIRRLQSRQFRYVVLTHDIRRHQDDAWYWRLPQEVVAAVLQHYRLLGPPQAGYFVYVPR